MRVKVGDFLEFENAEFDIDNSGETLIWNGLYEIKQIWFDITDKRRGYEIHHSKCPGGMYLVNFDDKIKFKIVHKKDVVE